MAVFLCRSGEAMHPPPAELRNAPRLVVRSEPVTLGIDHRGKKITARSDSHYACAEPTRESVRKKNYARRSAQLTQCGFHCPPNCPYRDVGEVELDDKRLIREGLGQRSPDKASQQEQESVSVVAAASGGEQPQHQAGVWITSPYRVRLRAKTPLQFPTELASLDEKLEDMEERLELVRKGRGLFKLMQDREMEKLREEQLAAQIEEEAKRNAWSEPEVTSDVSLSNTNDTIINGSASPEASALRRESSVVLDVQTTQERQASEESSDKDETLHMSVDNKAIVEQWYRRLCVLVWILEAMRMEHPSHMTPISECWRLDRPPPNEAKGKKRIELLKTQLQKFDTIIKEHKQMKEKPKPFSTSVMVKTQQNNLGQINSKAAAKRPSAAVRLSHSEERSIRRQKKLSPAQLENLMIMIEEELNYSKKQSKSRVNALIREAAGQARTQGNKALEKMKKRMSLQLPPISLDVSNMERQFLEAEEAKRMIVHEQLKAMERDHGKATQQRFGSLKVSGNIWKDLKMMRQGVEIETTSMARRRLLMNYEWYPELLSKLTEAVKTDNYCKKLLVHLADLADYMSDVGPWKMSKKKLTQVLATLRPWELENPDIKAAVQFLTCHVIYIVSEDYSGWLNQHKLASSEVHTVKTKVVGGAGAPPPTNNKLHVKF